MAAPFNDIESKLEEAFKAYLDAAALSASVTSGLSVEPKESPNVTVYCESANERLKDTGNYECEIAVDIFSPTNRETSDDESAPNPCLTRHRALVATVRDLIMTVGMEETISALVSDFAIQPKSRGLLRSDNSIDPELREFVTSSRFTLICGASDF